MPGRRYEAVFFDVGGTLAWAEPSADEIWARSLEEHGHRVSPADVRLGAGAAGPEINREDIIRAFREVLNGFDAPFPRTKEEQRAYFRRFDTLVLESLDIPPGDDILDTVSRRFEEDLALHLFDEVRSTLEALRSQGFRMGVISNATHDLPDRLDRLGLTPYFEAVTYSYEVGFEKPDRRIFETALRRLAVEAEDAVHVGDNYDADILGARSVGITPALLSRDGSSDASDCIVLGSLEELLDHL